MGASSGSFSPWAGGPFSTSRIEAVERELLLLRRLLRLLGRCLRASLLSTSWEVAATGLFPSATTVARPSFNLAAFPLRRPNGHTMGHTLPPAERAGYRVSAARRVVVVMRRRVPAWERVRNAICRC